MKKILISLLMVVALGCTTSCTATRFDAKNKCLEEFTQDYDEEVVYAKVEHITKDFKGYYIVTVYGEEHLSIYLTDGTEVWNYVNQSN